MNMRERLDNLEQRSDGNLAGVPDARERIERKRAAFDEAAFARELENVIADGGVVSGLDRGQK